jgi:hypothetical protein
LLLDEVGEPRHPILPIRQRSNDTVERVDVFDRRQRGGADRVIRGVRGRRGDDGLGEGVCESGGFGGHLDSVLAVKK